MALVAQKTQDKADIETDLNDEKADMKGKNKDLVPWSLAKSIALLKIRWNVQSYSHCSDAFISFFHSSALEERSLAATFFKTQFPYSIQFRMTIAAIAIHLQRIIIQEEEQPGPGPHGISSMSKCWMIFLLGMVQGLDSICSRISILSIYI